MIEQEENVNSKIMLTPSMKMLQMEQIESQGLRAPYKERQPFTIKKGEIMNKIYVFFEFHIKRT